MKIRLIDDRVLVKPVKVEEQTKAGIIIPTAAKERPNEGEIVQVGPGSAEYPMAVSVGERAFYGKHAGSAIEIEGEPYLIMRQSDILAIV